MKGKRWRGLGVPLVLGLLLIATAPAITKASIAFNYGFDNALAQQTVNFTPANSGTTVVGDTNPAPVYNVYVDALDPGVTLAANGSNVGNDAGNAAGFNSIRIRPEAGYAWTYFDMQLDSLSKDQPLGKGALTLSVVDNMGATLSAAMDFPWEGNSGENQHYYIVATGGEYFTQVKISYTDPLNAGNQIQDIHNIDVASIVVPEPTTMTTAGLSLVLGLLARYARLRRKRS